MQWIISTIVNGDWTLQARNDSQLSIDPKLWLRNHAKQGVNDLDEVASVNVINVLPILCFS